jgi:hypothetical protein
LRLQELVHQLDIHGDPIDDKKVILKYLHRAEEVQADGTVN